MKNFKKVLTYANIDYIYRNISKDIFNAYCDALDDIIIMYVLSLDSNINCNYEIFDISNNK